MTAEEHQHKIRKGELKEKASMIDGSIELKKKEYKKRSAEEKKIMRDAKKR